MFPDLPGKTHGIKHVSPIIVQCDNCRGLFSSRHSILAVRAVYFNSRYPEKGLRLCSGCWADRGWYEADYESARGDKKAAWEILSRDNPSWERLKITVEEARQIMEATAYKEQAV